MDPRQLSQHTSHQFDAELEEVRNTVLEAGGLVESQLASALEALMRGDGALAEKVIEQDRRVNELELALDDECTRILARRQPVASDLRLVIAALKAMTDIERMGDEAVRIARMAVRVAERPQEARGFPEIRHLGEHVRRMLHDALDAFARTDVQLAAQVVQEDREVDREYDSITRELITYMMEDPRSIPRALGVQWSARALERIGDRACNLAEYVIYLAHGTDVRHTSLQTVLDEAGGEPPAGS